MRLLPVFLFLAGTRAAPGYTGAPAGGFLESCKDVAVGEKVVDGKVVPVSWQLSATCGSDQVRVNIDECIGNNNGKLDWKKW